MNQISKDLALISKAAKAAKYPVLGVRQSTDDGGVKIVSCEVLIMSGEDTCKSWNPITSEKDLYWWLVDIGFNPFHHGFVPKISPGWNVGLPDDYEPALGPFEDKHAHSRDIVSKFTIVIDGDQK